jgi:hypothetical protein
MLGLWSYVVSPAGARELLRQVLALRQNGKVRTFQQVDMFIAHRLDQLKVYVLEPSSELAREFEVRPDVRHVLSHMRQTGIVRLKDTPSLNSPLQNQETTDMIKMRDDITQLIESGQHQEAWDMSRKALKTMRRFSCWETSSLLQKAGIALLKLLADNEQGAPKLGGPERTLLTALEALAMARLFVEGTWLDQVKQSDYKKLVRLEINRRKSNGLTVVEPTGGWENRTPLPGGGWLEATMPPNLKVAI